MDDDDEPLVFKRSSSSAKQKPLGTETTKSSSQKHERLIGRSTPEARSQNGHSTIAQKCKAAPPFKSPMASPKPSNSSPKALPVKFSEGNSKPSTSVSGESKSSKQEIKEEKLPNKAADVANADSEDSEDDKPLSARKINSNQGNKGLNASNLGQKPTLKSEDSDDEAPIKSPSASQKPYKPSLKALPVKSSEAYTKPFTPLVSGESKSFKQQIKEEEPPTEATSVANEDSEDSEDDKPLSARLSASLSKINSNQGNKGLSASKMGLKPIPKSEDSDDELPLSSKFQVENNDGASTSRSFHSDEKKPLSARSNQNGSASTEKKPSSFIKKRPANDVKSASESSLKKPKLSDASTSTKYKEASVKVQKEEDDDEDHVPISQRMKKPSSLDKKSSVKNVTKPVSSILKKTVQKSKKFVKNSNYSKSSKELPSSGEGKKWSTLVHNGVIFPPPYNPHGVKMLYKGKPVDLTPEQEEVATMYALMLETDYMSKPQFRENFMTDWRKILGKNHIIQNLDHCDFTPIYEWHQKEKEKKKQISSDEKKAIKEEKMKQEEKYMWAIVDGVKEKVGNFRVEPPGLFRGRGEHPKMGKLKKRIRPSDITINIGRDAPIPDCPIPSERWKEIRHDNTVTWLAYWIDPINSKEFKYVFLAASSTLKGQSDKEKYEKARLLKDYIHGIRTAYTKDFSSKDPTKKQIAVATYLIDKLALRAGNEKDDDEADTVGCCTLKVENVEPVPPNILKFDFLGKDSIRYQNEVVVETLVFKAVQQFRSGKKGGDDLFDKLDTSRLNTHLKELMPGLTAKVFRTYNASITLDEMLSKEIKGGEVAEKVVVYNHANKEVAIICNHQRTVSKSHGTQMSRLNEKIEELKSVLEELRTDLSRAKKGKPPLKGADGKPKRNLNPDALERKIAQTEAKIEKMERDKETKEDLKTVALGTSKINYLDPRITVAWCKRQEVPIEKMFNKSLLAKFAWSMDVEPDFRF